MAFARIGTILRWSYPGTDLRPLEYDTAGASESLRETAQFAGFKQRIGDAAAIEYRTPSGAYRAPTMAEKRAKMAAVVAVLESGAWSAERSGGAGIDGVVVTAMVAWRPDRFADEVAAREWIMKQAANRSVRPIDVVNGLLPASHNGKTLREIVSAIETGRADMSLADSLVADLDNMGD